MGKIEDIVSEPTQTVTDEASKEHVMVEIGENKYSFKPPKATPEMVKKVADETGRPITAVKELLRSNNVEIVSPE